MIRGSSRAVGAVHPDSDHLIYDCAVSLCLVTRALCALLGAVYVLVGAGAMVLPAGWIPPQWAGDAAPLYAAAAPDSFLNHLTQEFGTVVIAVGLVFLWQARRAEPSRSLHWLLTLYLVFDSTIHWVGPQGFIGSWRRGLVNSIPPLVMLILGLLLRRHAKVEGGLQTAPARVGGSKDPT